MTLCSALLIGLVALLPGRSQLETDLKIEREWRGSLQRNLEQEKEKVAELQGEVQQSRQIKKVGSGGRGEMGRVGGRFSIGRAEVRPNGLCCSTLRWIDTCHAFCYALQDHEALQRKQQQMQQTCAEQEAALAELGSHLSE